MIFKKGLTPLTITLFLLVFSVFLGAFLMIWGQTYVEKLVVTQPTVDITQDTQYLLGIQFKNIDGNFCTSDTGYQELAQKTAKCR